MTTIAEETSAQVAVTASTRQPGDLLIVKRPRRRRPSHEYVAVKSFNKALIAQGCRLFKELGHAEFQIVRDGQVMASGGLEVVRKFVNDPSFGTPTHDLSHRGGDFHGQVHGSPEPEHKFEEQ